MSLSSAQSITAAVNPPRAVYIDYPLGHTAGKPGDAAGQRRIMLKTLRALESAQQPGTLVDLGEHWDTNDDWKDQVMRPREGSESASDRAPTKAADDRVERHATPQYQLPEDAAAAGAAEDCATCIWLEA